METVSCKVKHIKDIIYTCIDIIKFPKKDHQELFSDLIDDHVCRYIATKGTYKNKFCLRPIRKKEKDEKYLYNGNF